MKRDIHSITDLVTGPVDVGDIALYHQTGGWKSVLPQSFDVRAYGAYGDDSHDDTVAIQAAIDAAYAGSGGIVSFAPGIYRCVGLILKSGVVLQGPPRFRGSGNTKYGARLRQVGAGIVIDTPSAAACDGAQIQGLQIIGLGAATAGKGIRFRDANGCAVKDVTVHGFADEGILVDSTSISCVFEDLLTTQILMNRTRSVVTGAFDISGTDHQVNRCEIGISGNIEGTVQSVNLRCVAVAWRADTSSVDCLFGEISDVGIYISGTINRFSNSRADLNYGHGWQIAGNSNQFVNCNALSNSQDTTNTYSNFRAETTGQSNQFVNCFAANQQTKKTKYGFEDLVQSDSGRNHYVNCRSTGSLTFDFLSQTTAGSAFSWPAGTMKSLTANSTTPDVSAYERFQTANSSGTTITDFVGGVQGQRLTIFCNDVNTTIAHGSTISLMNSFNLKLISGRIYEFLKSGTVWRQIWDRDEQVSADSGNAAKNIRVRVDETTQVFNTPLTANRILTMLTTGSYNGARFRVVRTAASTGAFTLDVTGQSGGLLKSLAPGTWCDVEYTPGGAWMLTGYGAL